MGRAAQTGRLAGTLDWPGAWTDVVDGLLHGGMLAICAVRNVLDWQLRRGCRGHASRDPRRYRGGPGGRPTVVVQVCPGHILAIHAAGHGTRCPATCKAIGCIANLAPGAFVENANASAERYAEWVLWDRDTLWPKYPLAYRVPMAEALQTVAGDDYEVLLDVARTKQRSDPRRCDSRSLGARPGCCPSGRSGRRPGHTARDATRGRRRDGARHAPHAAAEPVVVHQVERVPPLHSRSPQRIKAFTEEVLFPQHQTRDSREGPSSSRARRWTCASGPCGAGRGSCGSSTPSRPASKSRRPWPRRGSSCSPTCTTRVGSFRSRPMARLVEPRSCAPIA